LRRAWPDDPSGPAWFTDAGYQTFARTPGEFVAVRAPTVGAVDDVVLSGTFRKMSGPPGGGYGLIVRDQRLSSGDGVDQSGQFIVAAVGDRGDLGIWRRDGGQWIDLVPWTASAIVRPGGSPNDLRVEVSGDRMHFDVNGSRVADLAVPYSAGRVGLFVGGDANQVLIDRLVVQPLASARRTDLAAKEGEIASATARLGDLSARAKSPPSTAQPVDGQWQREIAGVQTVVHQVAQDLTADYAGSAADTQRVSRVVALVRMLEADVAGVIGVWRDGFDAPHSPVNDRAALADAARRLDDATRTAEELRAELQNASAAYAPATR